jgi:predicted TPR repeat methyltransferase
VGGRLVELGHDVVGVDLDPVLIEAAVEDHPGATWIAGDLAEVDLAAHGISEGFDVIVAAGNVMAFLGPSTRVPVLANMAAHLRAEGRIVVGFGAGRDYDFADFFADVEAAGLVAGVRLSSWDLRPFVSDSDFLVAVLSSA